MPTICREKGFRLFFHSNERMEPPHVHVQYQSALSKFWIQPVGLARNLGMNVSELRKASQLVTKHEGLIRRRWDEYFSKKS
ncbi:MAG: hypothetical protein A3I11_03555 [Elusimicrobia bacterium RIFCSPLOWO2_02_FULL_39_32]|nr:MAG: hypothetical protein A3B80_02125 [Elusimicrobia bacterium RIFCSPHIGHO2_02_FULL_39_36]OGR92784.1 MAG: hypothetical protein A3I11_03555 [Elusimicrobia bacterium RIFCSPLOWO2_02_FULL_39_32]OGR99569.1 MAG: hypothetical protein A3G85_00910 [Elusimicrobia bacterium RIFCSPLOWO2_12_FULL_39_28]